MALRYPLVLNDDNNIQEIASGDTINLFPTSLPVILRSGAILNIPVVNSEYIPVTTRTGTVINITVQS